MKKSIFTIILALFLIAAHAHVRLDHPQGGETFSPGQEITIEWTILIQHDTENFDLYFSTDGGLSWEGLQLNIPPDQLSYNWTVPEGATNEARIRIVQDNTGPDYEDESSNFSILGPTGINSFAEQTDFRIYPNPASDHVYLASDSPLKAVELHILNASGNFIAAYSLNRESFLNSRYTIPLKGLTPGMYFLVFKSEKEASIEKLMIY